MGKRIPLDTVYRRKIARAVQKIANVCAEPLIIPKPTSVEDPAVVLAHKRSQKAKHQRTWRRKKADEKRRSKSKGNTDNG